MVRVSDARHHHEEHAIVVRRRTAGGRDAKRIRFRLETLRACAHGVALQRVEHLLDPRPLGGVLADAVHQILPHRHDA
eukprot:5253869-Prymnesium_polylepis.1